MNRTIGGLVYCTKSKMNCIIYDLQTEQLPIAFIFYIDAIEREGDAKNQQPSAIISAYNHQKSVQKFQPSITRIYLLEILIFRLFAVVVPVSPHCAILGVATPCVCAAPILCGLPLASIVKY